MPDPTAISIREALLSEITTRPQYGGDPQAGSVLQAAARRLGITPGGAHGDLEKALLTQWGELFRTGLLAWGRDLSNPDAPHFHLTEPGRTALANLTRDPSNPAGYLRHLDSVARLGPIARSYLAEALDCYVAGYFKAAAVMTGAAAESIVLSLRDVVLQKLTFLNRSTPKGMNDWRAKAVSDALLRFLDGQKANFTPSLREEFEAYWPAFTHQLRATRNDAGHPTSVDPITYDAVHAALLVFPELAKLANALETWVQKNLA